MMIVYKKWVYNTELYHVFCKGWFLFGIIPLYLQYDYLVNKPDWRPPLTEWLPSLTEAEP